MILLPLVVTSNCFSIVPTKVVLPVENGIFKIKCPKCQDEFLTQEALKFHMTVSKNPVESCQSEHVNVVDKYPPKKALNSHEDSR